MTRLRPARVRRQHISSMGMIPISKSVGLNTWQTFNLTVLKMLSWISKHANPLDLDQTSTISLIAYGSFVLSPLESILRTCRRSARTLLIRTTMKQDLKNQWFKNSVEEALIKKAGGTFLWASLVLRELENTDNDRVRDKLDDFPADLDYLYDTILSKVERPDAVQVILQIMVATRRPLTLHELAMAYLVNRRKEENLLPSEDQLHEAKEIFLVCKQIVYLDKHNGTVNLIHQSVKDYILGDHLKKNKDLKQFCVIFERANLLVFQICWRYLTLNEFNQGNKIISRQSKNRLQREELSEEYLQRHYFLQYACQEWQEHVVAASSILVTDYEITKDNLDNASTLRDSWLFRVAKEGHEKVVQLLLEKGANADSIGSNRSQTPLSLAAERGQEKVVQLLLKKGANVDSKNSRSGQTPLSLAAERGHEKIVQLLLENDASVDSKDSESGQIPLSWAAKGGMRK